VCVCECDSETLAIAVLRFSLAEAGVLFLFAPQEPPGAQTALRERTPRRLEPQLPQLAKQSRRPVLQTAASAPQTMRAPMRQCKAKVPSSCILFAVCKELGRTRGTGVVQAPSEPNAPTRGGVATLSVVKRLQQRQNRSRRKRPQSKRPLLKQR
jgi:hypothetical protein